MEVRSPFTGRRGVCLPFSDACEPLIFDPEVVGPVRDELIRLAQQCRWKHLEIRGGKSLALSANPFTKFYGHSLDLRNGAETGRSLCQLSSPRHPQGRRSGVTAAVAHNRAAIDRVLPPSCANPPAARSSAATDLVFPQHLRAYHKPRSRFHCARAAGAASNRRRDFLPLWKERSL